MCHSSQWGKHSRSTVQYLMFQDNWKMSQDWNFQRCWVEKNMIIFLWIFFYLEHFCVVRVKLKYWEQICLFIHWLQQPAVAALHCCCWCCWCGVVGSELRVTVPWQHAQLVQGGPRTVHLLHHNMVPFNINLHRENKSMKYFIFAFSCIEDRES